MTRFILIDTNGGFIQSDRIAETPMQAVTEFLAEIGEEDAKVGFDVWVAPEGFPLIVDCNDQDIVRRVESECENIGIVNN